MNTWVVSFLSVRCGLFLLCVIESNTHTLPTQHVFVFLRYLECCCGHVVGHAVGLVFFCLSLFALVGTGYRPPHYYREKQEVTEEIEEEE